MFVGCATPESHPAAAADTEAIAHQAHEAYVTAINSNNLDSLLAMLLFEPAGAENESFDKWINGI